MREIGILKHRLGALEVKIRGRKRKESDRGAADKSAEQCHDNAIIQHYNNNDNAIVISDGSAPQRQNSGKDIIMTAKKPKFEQDSKNIIVDTKRVPHTNFTSDVLHFDRDTRFGNFSVPADTEAWKSMICPRHKSEYNIADLIRLEDRHMDSGTPFGEALKTVLGPRKLETIVRTSMKAPNWLEMLSRDDEPRVASEIYTNITRGVDVTMNKWPIKRSIMKNYKSCFENGNEDYVNKEVARLKTLGYLVPWTTLRKHRRSLPDTPIVVSAMSCVMKKGKCRLCVDLSRSTTEGQSVNEVVGEDATGKTFYTTVHRALDALCPQAYLAKADVVDCFMLTPLSERSILTCAVTWQGETLANIRLLFGARAGPYKIQDQQQSIQKEVYKRCRANGLPTGTIPKYRQPPPRNRPPPPRSRKTKRDLLISLGLILDDHLVVGLSLRSCWYAFYQLVTTCFHLGVVLSPRTPEKSASPTKTLTYMGVQISTRTMTCSLLPERCQDMRRTILQIWQQEWITRKQMMSLIGVMTWASIGIKGPARAAYRALIDTLTGTTDTSPSSKIYLTDASRADLQMWALLLKHANGATITKGVHTPVVPFVALTDASHLRWAWHTTDGQLEMGEWPKRWHAHIGYESEHASIWISHLEALTVLFCIRELAPACAGKVLRIYCDSLTTIYCLRKHSSKSGVLTKIIKNIEWILVTYACTIDIRMIASEDNVLSDYATRIGTEGFSDAGFKAELDKLAQHAKCFRNYRRTIEKPVQPQYAGILRDHEIVLAETSIEVRHAPRADLWLKQLERAHKHTSALTAQAPTAQTNGAFSSSESWRETATT